MIAAMKTPIVSVLLIFSATAFAQDMPVPKMFQALQGQKGQYQVEFLEGGMKPGGPKPPVMTVCTDNLMKDSAKAEKPQAKPDCKHRLVKDTGTEAVMESVCKERTTTVTMKREGKSMLMDVQSTGPRGPQTMKMRYTHLGPCREGQGALSLDRNSEQCNKMREQAAKTDPVKTCAGAGDNRAACEKQMRDAVAQMSAMCS